MDPSSTERRNFYVYALYRDTALTDPFYVGKGSGRRINAHEKGAEIAKRYNIRKNNQILKLKRELGLVPKKMIALGLSELEAFVLETKLIDQYGRLDIGTGCLTNLSGGGDGATPSAETRAKIRIARAQQVITKETRAKISAAQRGRRHTPESIAKMRAVQQTIPRRMSPEGRARQIAAVTGYRHTDEARASMSRSRTGKKLSPEHVAAIANSHRGTKRSAKACANIRAARLRKIQEAARWNLSPSSLVTSNP